MKIGSILLLLVILASCSKKEIERAALEFGKNDPTEVPEVPIDPPTDDGNTDPSDGTISDNDPPGPKYTTPVTIEFTWDIPTQREDNSVLPLNEINGYRMYFGFKENEWEPAIEIAGGSTTLYNFNVDADDNYYFAISTVDSDDVEGKRSPSLKASCIQGKCTVVSLPIKPPSVGATSESARIEEINDSQPNSEQVTTSNESIKKIAGKEICPAFPLKNIKKTKIDYFSNNIRVTSIGYNPKLIQCNWRRYHDEQSKKKHLIGLTNLNLHLPIFRNGDAFVVNKKLYIPYDITSMSNEQKKVLALKLGAREDGLDVERVFTEIPLQLASTYSVQYASYNEKKVQGDFAILNNDRFAATSTTFLPACEAENNSENNGDSSDTTTTEPNKDCYEANSFLKENLKRSPFLKSNLKNKRMPVLAIALDEEADLEKIAESINEKTSTLKLFQFNNTGSNLRRYVNFDFSMSETIERLNFSQIKISQNSKIDILNKIFNFKHKSTKDQALNYAQSLISDKTNVTPNEVLKRVPNISNFLMEIWNTKPQEGEKEDFNQKNLALKVLDYLYTPENNPVGEIARFYRLLENYYYTGQTRIEKARFFSTQPEAMVQTIFSLSNQIENLSIPKATSLDKAIEWIVGEKALSGITIQRILNLTKNYKESLKDINSQHPPTYDDEYYSDYYFPMIKLMELMQGLVVEQTITDERLVTHINLFKILHHYKYYYRDADEEYYYEGEFPEAFAGITTEFLTFSFEQIQALLFQNNIKDDQISIFKLTLSFLYEKNFVNMYSFVDAISYSKDLIFKQNMSTSNFYSIKNDFSFWTSRREAFISDTILALELSQNAVLGEEENIQRYQDLKTFYNAFRRYPNSDYPLNERRNALKYAYDKVIKQKISHKSAQLGASIISWFSRELSSIVSFNQAKSKYHLYTVRKGIDLETFNDLKSTYLKLISEGKTPKRALSIAERRHL